MFRSLRSQIITAYVALVLVSSLAGMWAIYNLTALSGVLSMVLSENYRSVLAAQNMIEELERHDSAILLALAGDGEEAERLIGLHSVEFAKWLGRAEDNITLPQEREIIARIAGNYREYQGLLGQMRALQKSLGAPSALNVYHAQAAPLFASTKASCRQLLDVNQQAMLGANSSAGVAANRAVWSTAAFSAGGLLLGLLLSLNVSGIIVRPVQRLITFVNQIADGALERPVVVEASGEIADLASQIDVMRRRLYEYAQTNVAKILSEQQRVEAIMRSIHDPIFVTDSSFGLEMVNPAAEQVFNIQEEAVLGSHMLESIRDDRLFSLVRSAVTSSTPSGGALITLEVGDNKKVFDVEVEPVTAQSGEFEGAVVVLKDVTRYRELDEIKSKFVSMVSHEFRTPLTSISMSSGLLHEMNLFKEGSDEQKLLSSIGDDARRLTKLVTELLDFSRLESGRIDLQFQQISLEPVVRRAVLPFESQALERHIEIRISLDPDLPQVMADPDKVTWVLTNLIGNAMRYTDSGGRIELLAESASGMVAVRCKDSGVGIPPEQQLRIFEPYIQVSAPGRPAGGAGLGLAISREIVQAHGGRIWVESAPGHGSTFIFTLPVATSVRSGEGD